MAGSVQKFAKNVCKFLIAKDFLERISTVLYACVHTEQPPHTLPLKARPT